MFIANKCIILVCCLLTIHAQAADTPRYIPATPENTRLADGSELPDKLAAIGWKWQPKIGNAGVYESIPRAKVLTSMLMVTATGLEPGQAYEVFGGFWVNSGEKSKAKNSQILPAGFGLTLASMHYFSGGKSPKIPWLVTPTSKMGAAYGLKAIPGKPDLFPTLTNFNVSDDGRELVFAQLGVARAAADGTLPVFVSTFPKSKNSRPTVIDGVLIRSVGKDTAESPAMNPKTILHLAIRAGDPVTLSRALAAGVDVNALDEEGLTPLFYASGSGDPSIVRLLLDHRADPNVAEQSVPPLTAAATVPSEEITAMLIKAGATVRSTPYETRGKLHFDLDLRFIHPMIPAIRSGSLPVARLLFAQVPDLNIESLFPAFKDVDAHNMRPNYVFDPKEVTPMPFLIAGAVGSGHWELAEWLLERGCKPVVPSPGSFYHWDGIKHPHVNLMIWAVAAGEQGLPFLNAMIRRGYSPVIQRDHYPDPLYTKYGLFPWDALSAACLLGNTSLVAKFLPAVEKLDSITQERLVSLAMYSENSDVLKLVRDRFPKASPPRFKPEKESNRNSQGLVKDEALRLLLPRTKPRPARDSSVEKSAMVMAVIASPEAAGLGDILAAYASAGDVWKVADRDNVEAALAEKNYAKPWSDGTHQLSDLGDKLAADVIVIVSKLVGKSLSIYRFEAVEVATGLEIHREHFQEKVMDLETDLKHFMGRTEEAMKKARMHERKQAVTLISFTANDALPNSKTLARMLQSAVRGKIDETPGFISLSRSQSGRLVEEQALTGAQSIWAAAHLVEAAVSPAADGHIKVALRLNTLQNGKKIQRDTEATGTLSELPTLAAKVWAEAVDLQETATEVTPSDKKQSKKHAQLEAARLVREVEWMMLLGMDVAEILPMIESASALGASQDKIIPLHLDCLFRRTKFGNSKHFDRFSIEHPPQYVTMLSGVSMGGIIELLPLPLVYSDRIINSLPAYTELLQQTSFYLQKTGIHGVNHDYRNFPNYGTFANQEFWDTIQFLSFVRAAVYTDTLTDLQRLEFESFGRDLDSMTRMYFDLLVKSTRLKPKVYVRMEVLDKHVLKRNPELTKGIALTLRFPQIRSTIGDLQNSQTNLCRKYDFTSWLNPQRFIATALLEQIPEKPSDYEAQLSSMAHFIIADSSARPAAFREIMLGRSKTHAASSKYRASLYVFGQLEINHTLGSYFDGFKRELPIHHGNKIIPHLIHSPHPAPDFFMQYKMYTSMSYFDASLPVSWRKSGTLSQKFRSRLDSIAKKHLREGNPELLQGLYDAALKWEMVSGEAVAASFAKNHKRHLRSKGEGDDKSLKALLAVDLRTVDNMSNGFFYQAQRDLRNPSDLWLSYHPYEGSVIPSDHRGDVAGDFLRRKPWLLEVDCKDYKIKKRINLAEVEGMSKKQNAPGGTINYFFAALVQSHDKFITNTYWGDPPRNSGKDAVSIIIDKTTGDIKKLPNEIEIDNSFVISLDNDFYLLSKNEKLLLKGYSSRHPSTLYHIDESGQIRQLTEYGRRPELTPFDSEGLFPRILKARGNKVFVANSRDYFGEYNPADQSWKVLPADTKKQREVYWEVMHKNNTAGKEVIKSCGGWSIDHDELSPGILNFEHPKHGKKQVRINIKLPSDFIDQVKYASKGPRDEKAQSYTRKVLSHAEHVKKEPLHLVLVNQTDDKLTLALQFGFKYKKLNRFLPFLWQISKEDVLRELK